LRDTYSSVIQGNNVVLGLLTLLLLGLNLLLLLLKGLVLLHLLLLLLFFEFSLLFHLHKNIVLILLPHIDLFFLIIVFKVALVGGLASLSKIQLGLFIMRGLPVNREFASLSECFVASRKPTGEGLLSRVSILMLLQILRQRESLGTVGATVWLLIEMLQSVPL
jgi:hypothetical protein